MTAEETSAATRTANLNTGIVHVTPGGTWSGGIAGWSGPMTQIELVGLPPLNATLPFDMPSVGASSIGPGASTTQIAQITIAGTPALRADGTIIPGRGVAGATLPGGRGRSIQRYELLRDDAATLDVVSRKAGVYDQYLVGGSVAATVSGARATAGQHDTIVVQPDEARLSFASDARSTPVTLHLDVRIGAGGRRTAAAIKAAGSARPTRSASVEVTAGGDRSDQLSLGDGRTLILQHVGSPTQATITLTDAGEAAPDSVTFAPIPLGADQRLSLRPDSWRDLDAGATFRVTTAGGRVVRSGRAVPRAPRVRLARGLTVSSKHLRRGRGVVTVSGRVLQRGRAPQLAVTVKIVRGGRVVASASASRRGTGKVRNGRFAVPVTVRSLPAGARAEVSVLLIDEAGLASVDVSRSARVR